MRPFAQISSRSLGLAGRAVACQVSPSIDTVASGLALRLWYQAGCFAPPQLDAMRARPSGCGIPYTVTVRGWPDLASIHRRTVVTGFGFLDIDCRGVGVR